MRGGTKGNRGGQKGRSGRKSKAEEFGLAALLDKVWGEEDRADVIKALHAQAKGGNTQAAALLLSYAYGKPKESVEHGGDGGGPIEVVVRHVKSGIRAA